MPAAESLVSWLLEHTEVQIPDMSDSDSISDLECLSDSDDSEEFELEGAYGASQVGEQIA